MALPIADGIEWKAMKWRVLECVLVIAIVLFAAQVFHPAVSGSQHCFSPDSLQSKYRSNEWLLGLLPIYDPRFTEKSSPLADHLVTKGYWAPSGAAEPRWIVTGHFSPQWKDGQSWLHRVLYWDDEQWIAWTEANPQLARLVWPQVLASLRRQNTESEAIELLFLAKHAPSMEQFRDDVQKSEFLGDELKKSVTNAAE
jgi:hypothetical protein